MAQRQTYEDLFVALSVEPCHVVDHRDPNYLQQRRRDRKARFYLVGVLLTRHSRRKRFSFQSESRIITLWNARSCSKIKPLQVLGIVTQSTVNAGECNLGSISSLFNARLAFASLRVYALWDRKKPLATVVGLLSIIPIGVHTVSTIKTDV